MEINIIQMIGFFCFGFIVGVFVVLVNVKCPIELIKLKVSDYFFDKRFEANHLKGGIRLSREEQFEVINLIKK